VGGYQPFDSALRRKATINEHDGCSFEVCYRSWTFQKNVRNTEDTVLLEPQESPVFDEPMNLPRSQGEAFTHLGNCQPREFSGTCHSDKGPTDGCRYASTESPPFRKSYVTNTLTAVTSATVIDAGIIL